MNVATSRILDLLADAVAREKREPGAWSWVWHHAMSSDERSAFDLFLVRMNDLLAYEAGTPESRFRRRVERMARAAA